jgi:hypothetical protein
MVKKNGAGFKQANLKIKWGLTGTPQKGIKLNFGRFFEKNYLSTLVSKFSEKPNTVKFCLDVF